MNAQQLAWSTSDSAICVSPDSDTKFGVAFPGRARLGTARTWRADLVGRVTRPGPKFVISGTSNWRLPGLESEDGHGGDSARPPLSDSPGKCAYWSERIWDEIAVRQQDDLVGGMRSARDWVARKRVRVLWSRCPGRRIRRKRAVDGRQAADDDIMPVAYHALTCLTVGRWVSRHLHGLMSANICFVQSPQ